MWAQSLPKNAAVSHRTATPERLQGIVRTNSLGRTQDTKVIDAVGVLAAWGREGPLLLGPFIRFERMSEEPVTYHVVRR